MLSLRHFIPSWSFIALLLAIYLSFLAFLTIFQDRLIFFPEKMTEERWQEVAEELHGDYVTIRTNEEGVHLQGWFFPAQSEPESEPQPRSTIIFFGGNAMRLDLMAYLLDPLRDAGVHILLVDYRGYGLSEGKPSAETMKADAVKLFDAAAAHPSVDARHIIAWGYSLGTGVAAHLASVRPVSKIILFAPFTSTTEIAKNLFPFVPVSLLLQYKLDTLALAPALAQPVLIVAGEKDGEISKEHAKRIAEAWGGPKELLVLPEQGHDDLLGDEGTWKKLVEFVQHP
ncbi:MAG: alpha/beta fold hydrolase [Patescibacteria group bacterium]